VTQQSCDFSQTSFFLQK